MKIFDKIAMHQNGNIFITDLIDIMENTDIKIEEDELTRITDLADEGGRNNKD